MLGELEIHILQRLASATVTQSSVALAAELWEDHDSPFTYDMVRFVLEHLNEAGLVVYHLSSAANEIPVRIRVTDTGYAFLGYGPKHQIIIGPRRNYGREDSIHPGDGTDFRNHGFHAEGVGVCERMTIAEHYDLYPYHVHSIEWLKGIPMQTNTTMPTKRPLGLGSKSANGEEIAKIMRDKGLHEGSARRMARAQKAEQIARDPAPYNQKAKILTTLLEKGKAQTVKDLRTRLLADGFVIDAHGLVHAVWSMQKDNHVTFRERRSSPVSWEGTLTAIRLTKAGTVAAQKVVEGDRGTIIAVGNAVRDAVHQEQIISFATRGKILEQAQEDAPKEPLPTHIAERLPSKEAQAVILERLTEETTPYVAEEVEPGTYQMVPDVPSPTTELPITFFTEFPLIGKMVNRQVRLESAAKILEEEGESDLAIQTLEKVVYSDFEKEVLRLVKAI